MYILSQKCIAAAYMYMDMLHMCCFQSCTHANCTYTCTCVLDDYMKIHVPSMLAKGVEKINKQTQQTSSHNGL